MCEFCDENETRKLIKVEVTYFYENPEAYGYPEVVYWDKKLKIDYCPMCGRKLGGLNVL